MMTASPKPKVGADGGDGSGAMVSLAWMGQIPILNSITIYNS